MNLFELFVKIGVDDQASGKLSKLSSSLGKGLATAAKTGAAAVGAAAAGITALTASAVNSFAEYEQLAGGAQKIFDQMDYSKIATDANNAYKELGLSANQYLAVINDVGATFAATMGDAAGYEAAKTGLKAISDYASGTGKNVDELSQKFTLITRSTSSYQSIADQFSGILPATSAGFLEQAQAAGILRDSYTQLTEVPIEEYQAAVSQMLQQGVADLGLANNTMDEAFSTLSGSLSMAKGAWSNLVTGLADDSANLDMLIGNFVESVGAVAANLIPKIGTALNGAAKLVGQLVPQLISEVPKLLLDNLPVLVEAAVSIVEGLIDAVDENKEMLFDMIFDLIEYISGSFLEMLPQIVSLGLDLLVSLAQGIAENLPAMIPSIISVIMQIVETLTDPETLSALLTACFAIIRELSAGLTSSIPQLVDATLDIIDGLVGFLLDPKNIESLIRGALEINLALGMGLIKSIPRLLESVGKLIISVVNAIIKTDWLQIGKDIVSGLLDGIKKMWNGLVDWISKAWDDLVGGIKDFLGIASPSKLFRDEIGKQMAAGVGVGWEDEFEKVKGEIDDSLDFNDPTIGINASVRKIGSGVAGMSYGGTSIGNITIKIDGAKYSDEQSLAQAVAEAIQSMTDRRAAVYA